MNKLPDGWQELPFSECVNKISIKHKIKQKYYFKNGKYPIIDQSQNFIGGYSNDEIAIKIKKPVIVFGDHTRCFKYIDFDFIAGADGIQILEPKEFFNEKLFYYFCLILDFPNKGYSRHYQYLAKTMMKIPPIEVQKKIASRLDFSFDNIDKALELLYQNREHIKKYRLSLLKYAFDGKLTPSSKNWEIKTLNDVCNIYTGNSINKQKKEKNFVGLKDGLNYIGTKDIGFDNIINYNNGIKIPFKDLKDFKIAKTNSSLLCIEGGSAGRKIGFTNQDICFGNKLCCFEAIDDEPKFIYYYLQSDYFLEEFNSNIQGLIGGVRKETIRKIKIPIPPIEVQKEIVSILEERFEVMEKVEKLNNENIENLLLLKKSLLKQAFSGELEL